MITKSQVKYIQSLGQKKFRDQEQVFIAEGPKIINELLATHLLNLVTIYASSEWLTNNEAFIKNIPVAKIIAIKDAELERISFLSAPNMVLGIFKKPNSILPTKLDSSLVLMLDGIQDPGNMGTIIRIADWYGIDQLICSMDSADAFAPKVVQSSMGSIARVNILYTELLEIAGSNPSIQMYAATLQGKDITAMNKLTNGIIVIGNESKGIHGELLSLCQQKITIPGTGRAESLNAAVATGIILSHLV